MQRQLGGRDLSVSVFKVEGVTIKSEQSTQLQLVQQKNNYAFWFSSGGQETKTCIPVSKDKTTFPYPFW